MAKDPEGKDHTEFLAVERGAGDVVMSRAAYSLHSFAIVNSFRDGWGGDFIPDEYLNAIPAETTITVAELETLGLWRRSEDDDGYDVLDAETVAMVREADEQVARMDLTEPNGEDDPGGEPS